MELSKIQVGFNFADSERKAGQEKIQTLEGSIRQLNVKLAQLSVSHVIE